MGQSRRWTSPRKSKLSNSNTKEQLMSCGKNSMKWCLKKWWDTLASMRTSRTSFLPRIRMKSIRVKHRSTIHRASILMYRPRQHRLKDSAGKQRCQRQKHQFPSVVKEIQKKTCHFRTWKKSQHLKPSISIRKLALAINLTLKKAPRKKRKNYSYASTKWKRKITQVSFSMALRPPT